MGGRLRANPNRTIIKLSLCCVIVLLVLGRTRPQHSAATATTAPYILWARQICLTSVVFVYMYDIANKHVCRHHQLVHRVTHSPRSRLPPRRPA